MTTVIEEKRTIWTGSIALDEELSMLGDKDLEKLADYAKYLRWSREEEDDDWADAPLTPEEEAQLEESRKNFENGDYLTLEELIAGL